MKEIKAGQLTVGEGLFLIAGPCVIESEKSCIGTAEKLKALCARQGVPFIFKSSYLKANRTSFDSYAGPGIDAGLKILKKIKDSLSVPVITDVHCVLDVERCAEAVDILQIPAFLCRQTPLLLEAARTGLAVNVKKGQFLSPHEMKKVVEKLEKSGCENIIITERGTSFGYNNLVVDMRAFPIMKEFGYPVVFDATHSVQLPGAGGSESGGESRYALPLALAASAAGCDGLFLEVHPDPARALCDGSNMLTLEELEQLIVRVKLLRRGIGR